MTTISSLTAMEILDSRGNPTISVTATLSSGTVATAKVPSGASTGKREALELRDGDQTRYRGQGVLQACDHVGGEIQHSLQGHMATDQAGLDRVMIELDGTPDKSRLGANAILGVSLAVAKAAALDEGVSLYRYLATGEPVLPTPMLNVLNGGRHANNNLDFQEFMISPVGASVFRDGLRAAVEVFQALKSRLLREDFSTAVGDEGGFAPILESSEQAIDFILDAIVAAGYRPGQDIAIMLDPAASEFYEADSYVLRKSAMGTLTREELISFWQRWLTTYPQIWSLEDGAAEQDQEAWLELTRSLGTTVQLVGDDNFVTNPALFAAGIEQGIANAILIKLNQIGTVIETLRCIQLAQDNGYGVVVSHRSGETDDTSIADLAVATGAGQIKTGSASRGERIAKYNRLLEIERELGSGARYARGFPMPAGTRDESYAQPRGSFIAVACCATQVIYT